MSDFSDSSPVGREIRAGTTPMEFTQPTMSKRKAIRMQRNPMDKCTIVSIFPKEVEEVKPTIEPGKFVIPAGTLENPAILVIGSSSWWKDYDYEQPLLEIVNSSIQIADSIIKDWCNGMLGCDMGNSMPGLFFVLGEHKAIEIKMNYKKKLDEMNVKQTNWYRVLVRLADSLWARTSGNPLAIWDEMRLAARELNLNDKPWLKDYAQALLVRCKFCGSMKDPAYPICSQCHGIDQDHPLAKDIRIAAI